MKKYRPFLSLLAALILTCPAMAAGKDTDHNQTEETIGQPWTGTAGIREANTNIMTRSRRFDAEPHARLSIVRHHGKKPIRDDVVEFPLFLTNSGPYAGVTYGPFTNQPGPLGSNSTALEFTAATLSDCHAYPPDTMGAVGPAQFIVAVNGRLRSFSKATGLADGVLDADTDVFFNSVMTPPANNNFTSDPRIRYDRLSGKWFVIIIDVPGQTGTLPNRVLLAVSDSSIITAGTVWSFFQFQHDLVSPTGDTGDFADYPTLGIDANALYIGVNQFKSTGSFDNTTAFVVRKSSLLSGGPIVVTAFRKLISGTTGPYTPQGVDNFNPAATEGYIIGVDATSSTRLRLRRVSNPGGTPTISANVSLTVASFASPITVPHLGNTGGTAGELDGLDERLLAAHYRNGYLWTAHNVGVNSSGGSSSITRNGVRWYQISGIPTGSTPAVTQTGTVYDSTTSNRFYWMGSIMVSGQGHAALGFSTASATTYINAAATCRLTNDTAGTMRTPVLYTASTTAYNPVDGTGAPINRWGDYSYTSLDPNDDMTLWTIQEFCNSANSYGVQVARLLAPPPAIPTNCSPNTVTQGVAGLTLTLTGSAANGAGFFDPGAGFSNRLAATISGGITINSITYSNPTKITLNITIATNATAGACNIILTNPDGQTATNTSTILTIATAVVATNHPPTLTAVTNRTLFELTTLQFTNSASDPDTNTLTFSLLNAPTNATIGSSSGVFVWTPNEAQGPSSNFISVVVTDNGSPALSTTQSFTVVVLETNVPPTLTAITNKTIYELSTLTFTNTASDTDIPTNTLTFSLLNAPTNATINPATGVFVWTPNEAQGPGSNFISVIVTDNGSPALSATQSFTVVVLETNAPPTLTAITNKTIYELSTLTFANTASDTDIPTNTLTFSLLNAPTNATIGSSSGVFAWTPTEAQGPGSNFISVVVTDNGSPALSATQSFTVVVLETNAPPTLTAITNHTVHVGSLVTFTNIASDSDLPANTLTFNLDLGIATGATLDSATGVFAWTPDESFAATTNLFTVRVSDNGSPVLSDTQSFTVTVEPLPAIQSPTVTNDVVTLTWSAVAGQSYRLQLKTNLTDASWTDVPGDFVATGDFISVTNNTSSNTQLFYRVLILP